MSGELTCEDIVISRRPMRDVHLQPSVRDLKVGYEEHWATSISQVRLCHDIILDVRGSASVSCCRRRSSLQTGETGLSPEVVFAGMPSTQLEAALLMHPFATDVALVLAAVAAELAVAVSFALTLLRLALVAVLGAVSMPLVLFKVPLVVSTLLLSLESCLGKMRRPMKVAGVAVLCSVLPWLVVEAFRTGSLASPLAASTASMIAGDDLRSSVSVRVYDRARRVRL